MDKQDIEYFRNVQKQLKENKNNPDVLSLLHNEAAHHFMVVSDKYAEKLPLLMKTYQELLQNSKSVSLAEKLYKCSEAGIFEKRYKLYLEAYTKFLSSIKQRLEMLREQMKNNS